VICDRFAVLVVPFPFADKPAEKRRPALVLSHVRFNSRGHTIMTMITTARTPPWPGDVELRDLAAAGLQAPCIVRLKLFTLDNRLLVRLLGALAADDRKRVTTQLSGYLFPKT